MVSSLTIVEKKLRAKAAGQLLQQQASVAARNEIGASSQVQNEEDQIDSVVSALDSNYTDEHNGVHSIEVGGRIAAAGGQETNTGLLELQSQNVVEKEGVDVSEQVQGAVEKPGRLLYRIPDFHATFLETLVDENPTCKRIEVREIMIEALGY